MKFYTGFDWSVKRRKINTYPLVFLSVAVNYSYNCYKKLTPWKINGAKDIMIDSGGFSFLNRFGDYPFKWDVFTDWVYSMQDTNGCVDYVATPDYPCEPDITRSCNLATNRERIIKTIDNAVIIMDSYPDIHWMPVLQGYTIDEYIYCLDLYRSRGIYPDKFAIGSMCRRTNVKEIESYIIKLIKSGLKEKIHLFGLLKRGMKSKYLYDNVDSCDSNIFAFGCKTLEESLIKFEKQHRIIGNLLLKNEEQITLMDYIDLP